MPGTCLGSAPGWRLHSSVALPAPTQHVPLAGSPLPRRRVLRLLGTALAAATTVSLARPPVLHAEHEPAPPAPRPGGRPPPAPPTPTVTPPAPPSRVWWVQALRPTPLWSGAGEAAVQLDTAARWDYLQVLRPQQGARLEVLVARTNGPAWVDALAVGPSGPPPPGWPPADRARPAADLSVGWLATVTDAPLYAGADSPLLLGTAPPFTAFKQVEPQSGPRLRVQDPYSGADSWVEAILVGPVGAPEAVEVPGRWWGVLGVDAANLRPAPTTREPALGQLPGGSPLVVSAWVEGDEVIPDNPTWGQLGEGAYLHSSVLRPVALPSAPPTPPDVSPTAGLWIDLNLTHQVTVAYEGVAPVYLARTSTGRPGWETTPGFYRIQRRVENETMDSSTLLGLDAARADYKVENVRWTQYFTADGKALHENYWKPRDQFGIPSSHGCVGLVAEDARFFWEWASLGTPVYAHY